MKYNKLVRDRIPEIIERSGRRAFCRKLSDAEYIVELERKLDEAVAEFHLRKNIEELVDIMAIIEALSKVYGGGAWELQNFHRQKMLSQGGFDLKIFLEEVNNK